MDRWDYRSAADIERVIEDCRQAGFSSVMFQVRGNGTVLYPSAFEIWSEGFEHSDPGFDPLAVAIQAAHSRGLELHAWVNLMPGWRGSEPPEDRRQLWHVRREWFLEERLGSASDYVNINPCLPEVRRHLADLCGEIASRYDIDGVHLDYVRFPDPTANATQETGLDHLTRMLFSRATGRPTSDHDALRRWQADCVTELVREVRQRVRGAKPEIPLTAAVIASPSVARTKVKQDWTTWCRFGLIDAVFPMNYTGDDARFEAQAQEALEAAYSVPVIMGVGIYKLGSGEQARHQMDEAIALGAAGVAVFSYRTMFGHGPEVDPLVRAGLRRDVRQWMDASARRR
ncbi:MAG: family 10 glycosylhydrolase [Planctomycetota bacterium]|nr:family 10 glycosylhydrolase [Planctomycetota bacterium]